MTYIVCKHALTDDTITQIITIREASSMRNGLMIKREEAHTV
jgi:hypothetical protein